MALQYNLKRSVNDVRIQLIHIEFLLSAIALWRVI